MKNSFYLIFLIAAVIFNQSFGQREIRFKRGINLKVSAFLNTSCDYELLIPYNRAGKQEVIESNYSITPKNLLRAPDNEVLAKWEQLSFSVLEKAKIEVRMRIKLYTYDLNTAKKHPVIDHEDLDTLKYLKPEENFLVRSKKIQDIADAIRGAGREEITHHIFDFTVNKLNYKIFADQDRSAKKALNDGEGDCTEYSELMVTLCRAKKIPARIQMGIVLKANEEIRYHNWVEVFFDQYGWVAFDPTWADHPNSTTTFYKMQNCYVQLSNRRYIKNIYCSCSTSEYSFSYRLEDSYSNFDPDEKEKALFKKMYILYSSKESEKALDILDTLLSYKTNLDDYYKFKGVIYARLGDFDKGIEYLQASIKHAKTNDGKIQSLYAFSNYFAIKGDKEYAVMYLKKAVELGFKDYTHLIEDEDFKNIKDYQPFIDLENELKASLEK